MHPIEIINNTPKWHDWVRVDLEKDKNILLHNQLITLPDPTGEKYEKVYKIEYEYNWFNVHGINVCINDNAGES